MKNIVICCDGTMAEYGADEQNTNVVRLFERLGLDGVDQVSYYDPGVGTHSFRRTRLGRFAQNLVSSAVGYGVGRNVSQAYAYLMDAYAPGDRIYLFGYSRGAHTVRVLAGLICRCGLLTKGSNNLIPYAMDVARGDAEIAANFRAIFSRKPRPHFIGVWDTVASVGWAWRRRFYRSTGLDPGIPFGCQALAVDENRWHFRPSLWDEGSSPEGQTIEQVWFPGVHSDVGGQGADRRISDITLEWMIDRAEARGLMVRPGWRDDLIPDPAGRIGRSWMHRISSSRRSIPSPDRVHESAWQRRVDPLCGYDPPNLPPKQHIGRLRSNGDL